MTTLMSFAMTSVFLHGMLYAQAKGVALVIGNTNYPSNELSNAASDAKDIASELTDLVTCTLVPHA